MRILIKLPLLSLFCLLAVESVVPSVSFAGTSSVVTPESGAGTVSDSFSNPGSASTEINNGFNAVLQEIRTQQSVPAVNGETLSVSESVFSTLVQALSSGKGFSPLGVGPTVPSGSSLEGAAPSGAAAGQPGQNSSASGRDGGNIFGLRRSSAEGSSGTTTSSRNRPGGNVFGLRNSDLEAGSIEGAPSDVGGNVFGLRTADGNARSAGQRGHSGAAPQAGLSDQALTAVSALEQQIFAETGILIDVDIIGVSERNYGRAVSASNRLVRQLSDDQIVAVADSPTFIALLKLLGNANLDDDESSLIALVEGGLGIPLLRLR